MYIPAPSGNTSWMMRIENETGMYSMMNSEVRLCNCWCTSWAEVYIPAPSGNTSWMMRIENETGMYSMMNSEVRLCNC